MLSPVYSHGSDPQVIYIGTGLCLIQVLRKFGGWDSFSHCWIRKDEVGRKVRFLLFVSIVRKLGLLICSCMRGGRYLGDLDLCVVKLRNP